MLFFWCILGILLLLAVLVLCLPAEAGIVFHQNQKVQNLTIHVRLLGLPLSFAIPLLKDEKKPKKEKEQEKKEKKEALTPRRFITLVKQLGQAYRESKADLRDIISELRHRVTCKELSCTIDYGAKNPALTGMLNGAIWTAGTLLLKITDSLIGVKEMHLHVHPDFTKELICLHFSGILKLRPVHLVIIVLKIVKLVNIMKSKITF